MLKQIEGSKAVAEAVAASRPQVICAYPITPQTHIVEALGVLVKKGELNAGFLNVEAEGSQVVSAAPIRHRVPVTDYLRLQARYAHLFRPTERTDVIARLQAGADRNIARFGLLKEQDPDHPERTRLTPGPVHDSDQRR